MVRQYDPRPCIAPNISLRRATILLESVSAIRKIASVSDVELTNFGYAFGSYNCICSNCGKRYVGGPWSLSCRPCATREYLIKGLKLDAQLDN